MAIISSTKKEIEQELLAGKPVTISNLKNGEVLTYNSLKKRWEAKTLIVKLTQAEYDALAAPVETTLYIIVG